MSDYVALIPAAGAGLRMGEALPKQYRPLLGEPMVAHAARALWACPDVRRVYVVLGSEDQNWERFDWSGYGARLAVLRCGGATRAESVANGLAALAEEVPEDAWVLVHDAARPCLRPAHVARLIHEIGDDDVGGLLAVPVADTLKRADDTGRVLRTEPRDGLWQAQTPQMFRFGVLRRALADSAASQVTDESRAVELLGLRPRLVNGDLSNLKVTFPHDLPLAERILRNREATDEDRAGL
ncbi:MAG TPA: 2-C-methyl-D-erythritol 4-phosphate cytidylyltransferase [Pelomicrobium sp.]|nr:2-C-methyl-D-erythritol 4-phosphate cytidylyltransferase [Pelomicrobium sp.]